MDVVFGKDHGPIVFTGIDGVLRNSVDDGISQLIMDRACRSFSIDGKCKVGSEMDAYSMFQAADRNTNVSLGVSVDGIWKVSGKFKVVAVQHWSRGDQSETYLCLASDGPCEIVAAD